MNKMLTAALWYQRRDVSIFPICPDKKVPLVPWKPYQERCAAQGEIARWWGRWPTANIGMACGKVSGATVIDCDTAEAIGRVETFLPDGLLLPIVETPKGGRHYYFAHSPSLKNWVGAFPGVDIRTTGGQVLLPPSAKGDRIYRWLNGLAIHQVERPPMPQKLVSAILHATKKEDPIYKSKRVDPGAYGAAALAAELATLAQAVKGERNANLNRAAYSLGQLVAGGEIDAGQVEGGLMAMAISIGLSQSESMRTIKSGMASGAAKPRKSKKDFEKRQRNPQSATPRFKKKYARVRLIGPA